MNRICIGDETTFMKLELRAAIPENFHFAFMVKKQAMGEHIAAKWTWDEEFQLDLHRVRWSEKPWFIINGAGHDIGTVSLYELKKNLLRFGEFYLLDDFRNNGLGTTILRNTLERSDRQGQTVVLEVLKWNPVRSLYERHGFRMTSENENHYFMERKPNA